MRRRVCGTRRRALHSARRSVVRPLPSSRWRSARAGRACCLPCSTTPRASPTRSSGRAGRAREPRASALPPAAASAAPNGARTSPTCPTAGHAGSGLTARPRPACAAAVRRCRSSVALRRCRSGVALRRCRSGVWARSPAHPAAPAPTSHGTSSAREADPRGRRKGSTGGSPEAPWDADPSRKQLGEGAGRPLSPPSPADAGLDTGKRRRTHTSGACHEPRPRRSLCAQGTNIAPDAYRRAESRCRGPQRRKAAPLSGLSMKKPAASYSPGPLRAKYHRR